jgi:beta-ribofuranosylaminobenzene 5'-phosphate synthase
VTSPCCATVTAPARLHLGFLDLNGGLGRRFGSVGLAIEGFRTRVRVSRAGATSVEGAAEVGRARELLGRLGAGPVRVEVLEAIPAHAGLGSGTQLGLALGTALAVLAGTGEGPGDVARGLERGARSGIGLGAFAAGGFLVDGGKGASDEPPPILSRLAFPEAWRLLLIFDGSRSGLSGEAERAAFGALPPFPAEAAARLCRLALMRLLPGVAEADIEAVGGALGEIQRTVGDHFAPAQGGRFASPAVTDALAWLGAQGVTGVGQSSWGPTGFALLPDEGSAERLRRGLEERSRGSALRFAVVAGRNRGAEAATC